MHLDLLKEQDMYVYLSKQRHFSLGFNVAMSKQKCVLQLCSSQVTYIPSLVLHVVYAECTLHYMAHLLMTFPRPLI